MAQYLTQASDFAQEKFSAALEHVKGRAGVFKASRKTLIDVCQALLSQSCTELTFLVTGKSGEGKSTLINSLVGRKVCQTGDVDAITTETKLIEAGNINGVDVRIYDTQGVFDGEDEEEKIFESIRGKKIDILIVCVSMVGRAQSRDTKDTISMITKELGQDIWERAVIVLTQANERQERNESRSQMRLVPTEFHDIVTKFNDQLHEYLRKAKDSEGRPIPADTIEGVPVVPAGIYLEGQEKLRKLPDCDDWLSRLWLACFRRFEMEARKTFMGMAQDRLVMHHRNGKVQTLSEALADNMLGREVESQTSGEPIWSSAVQPTSPGGVKELASNFAHLKLHGPNAHSPVASQKRGENVSNRSSLSSPVSEASPMTDITKGMSQEAPPHSSEGGAIHVNEEDLELGVMAESMLVGAACGAAVTGILGVGLMGLAEAAEDGSVHQKVLRGAGAAVAAVTGAPGALVGGILGAAVGGIRKLSKSAEEHRLQNERC